MTLLTFGFVFLASSVIMGAQIHGLPDDDPRGDWPVAIWLLIQLAMLAPILTVSVRRFHDVGWPGYWLVLSVPLCGVPLLIASLLPGSPGSNRYGEPPGNRSLPPETPARSRPVPTPDAGRARQAELDQALSWWLAALDKARESMARLLSDSHWDLLSDALRHAFTGRTEREFEAGYAAAERLQIDLPLLEDVVAQAHTLQPSTRWSATALDRALALLEGESVVSAPKELPLNQRGLLGPAVVTETRAPKAVLAAMEVDFATASNALVRIYAAWSDARQRRDRLIAEIDALKGADPAETAALRKAAVTATEAELADPLADHRAQLTALATRLEALRRSATAPAGG
jgi:uncharacterized membrane protein YhaH (DUF805 family)